MWQPTWSPHPPPGAQGAPLGQPAGTMALPPQGVQPHAMVAQSMNQQWMGNPTGSQGCPGNPPTLGSSRIWPWLSTSRISRNYVVTFSNVNSSTSTSATTTSTGYLFQPTGTQSRHTTVTFTSTSLVYKLPTPAKPILPAPATTVPPNQHTCGYQPNGSKSSWCTRSTSSSRCTRSTSSSSSSTSSRFPWPSKCPRPSSLSRLSSCPRPTVYPSSSSCSRSHSKCSYPARNTSGTDEWKPTHEPGAT